MMNDELGMMNDECNSALSTHNSSFNKPAIRFKGFSGEWVEISLDEISDVLDGDRGHNYPNGDDLKSSGHTLFLSASNITKNGFKLAEKQFISKEKSLSMGNGKLELDDIILTSRGSVGHIAWFNENIKAKVPFARINSGMLILRTQAKTEPSIISQYLKSPIGKKKIDLISFGSAQPQLTKHSVAKYRLTIPYTKKEQTQIGNFFQQLDRLIAQHQQKHDKLLSIKKALLEKMFPDVNDEFRMMNDECNSALSTHNSSFNKPAIRFKGFSEPWEEKSLDEISDVLDGDRGHNYPNGDDLKSSGHTLFLSASNITKNGFKLAEKQFISKEKSQSMGNGKLELDDIILTSRGSVGHIAWFNENIKAKVPFARINSGMLILRKKAKIEPSIISQYLKSPIGKKKIDLISFGSAQPQLTKHSVAKYRLTIPYTKKEQTKIGKLFQQLDSLISQQQSQLTKLGNIKQAMLAKMFA